jgi:hypothetical protein
MPISLSPPTRNMPFAPSHCSWLDNPKRDAYQTAGSHCSWRNIMQLTSVSIKVDCHHYVAVTLIYMFWYVKFFVISDAMLHVFIDIHRSFVRKIWLHLQRAAIRIEYMCIKLHGVAFPTGSNLHIHCRQVFQFRLCDCISADRLTLSILWRTEKPM